MLRWATPVMTFRRTVVAPTTLGGQDLSPGEKVVLFYSSGNRDAARFDHPWSFDLQRTDNDHVAFGGGGPHYCLGHFHARTQIRAMFRDLLGQLPECTVGTPS